VSDGAAQHPRGSAAGAETNWELTTMDTDLAGLAAQQTTCGLTDNPRQFTEAPLVGIFRQAWRQRYGHRDGMDYPTVPF
jgi:hypothetical protein